MAGPRRTDGGSPRYEYESMEIEDGVIWVYGVGEDGISALFRIPPGSTEPFYWFSRGFLALVANEGLEPPTHGS